MADEPAGGGDDKPVDTAGKMATADHKPKLTVQLWMGPREVSDEESAKEWDKPEEVTRRRSEIGTAGAATCLATQIAGVADDFPWFRPASNIVERHAVEAAHIANLAGYGTPASTIARVIRDVREQEEQRNIQLYGTPNVGAVERALFDGRIRRPSDPLADSPMLSNPLDALCRFRELLDAAMGGSAARAIYQQLDILEQQRRCLDPPFDRDFVHRLTGGPDDNLMRCMTALHEPDALRSIREQVDRAAALRITNQLEFLDQARQYAARDATAMAGEAQPMLLVYGPSIAEQTRFLSEYNIHLGLFRTAGLSAAAFERADLLAGVAMSKTRAARFDGYDSLNIEGVRAYGQAALWELEADFRRDGNPVNPWEALAVACRYGIDPPDWVQDFFADAANGFIEILNEVANGKAVKRELERVGQALGFGTDSPGRRGWFKHATMLKRDRTIFFEVGNKLEAGIKLDFAYDQVAKELDVSRSTVVRAYLRVKKLNNQAGRKRG